MKNFKTLLLCVTLFAGITSCDVEVDNGKYAEDVVGTYTTTEIESNLNGYSDLVATIVVTEVNDTSADINISFDNESLDDLELNSVTLSNGSGDDIDLDQEYTNATALGYVNGDDIRLKIEYDNEDFIDFTGSK